MTYDDDECGCGPSTETDGSDAAAQPILELEPMREGRGYRVYELIPRTTFAWDNVQASLRLTHVVSAYLRLDDVPEGLLVIRIHDNAIGTGAAATLVVEAMSLSSDQPELAFAWTLELARVRLDPTSGTAKSVTARLRCDVGTHLRVKLHLDQGGTVVANTVTISADFVARTAVEPEAESVVPCDRA